MKRAVVAATVLGALLVGGAGTGGSTYARWVDQVKQGSSSVLSGSMGFTAAAAPASLSVGRGTSGSTVVTVTDTSQGKNLVQRVTPTVAATNGVSASLVTRSGGSCTSTAQGPVALTPSQAFSTCVSVSVPQGTVAGSATVTVTLNGAQVRGGSATGWTFGPRTVSIPVTITGSVPAAPVLTCASGSGSSTGYTFSWPAVTDATGYTVHRSDTTNTDAAFGQVASQAATSWTALVGGSQTSYVRVKAVNAAGSSAYSNTLRLIKTTGNVTCSEVTP